MKKLTSLLLAVVLLCGLAACGGEDDSSVVPQSAAPAPVSNPVTSTSQPEEVELERAYLTGLEKTADYPEGQRIAAVMVNNIAMARPSYGLSEAKILVESQVEGGITRFMAMYEDYKTIPTVGSMRSARDQFVQLLIPTYGFYVHEGPSENQPANWYLRDYDYFDHYDLQPNDGPLYWDEPARGTSSYSWHNVDGEHIANTVARKGLSDEHTYGSPFFYFVPYDEPARVPEEEAVDEFTVVHSASYRTHFAYDSANAKYLMSMFNSDTGAVQATVDANNNQQLGFENVLVLYAPMSIWPGTEAKGGLKKFDLSVGGGGFYFSQGHFERIIWRKGAADQPLRLEKLDLSEDPVEINTGNTYIALVDESEAERFYAGLQEGTSGEHAGQGTVDTSLVGPAD